jgi:multicomponent Na+:H+ antiporter subunit D
VLVLPIIAPFFCGVLCLLALHDKRLQRLLALCGGIIQFVSGILLLLQVWTTGICAVTLGGWPAPFGITIAADLFSAIMISVSGAMTLAVVVYSRVDMDAHRVGMGYYPLIFFLLMGVDGAFLAGDIFNLYVWFEVMLISSFVLLVLGGERAQIEGAVKYVTLNLFASIIFLSATGILYGKAKTLNFAQLADLFSGLENQPMIAGLALLFLTSFGIKAGLFPLYFWLPASYHTPPTAITTLFSALLTKVGVYAIARVSILLFSGGDSPLPLVLGILAGLTMVSGVLGAVAQYDIRRLLSFHIISQIGYLLMGIAIGTTAALAAMIYFMIHVIFAKSALFIVSGILFRIQGSYDLRRLGGAYDMRFALSIGFLLPALSLAGIPPLSGFIAKLTLLQAGLEGGFYGLVGVALAVSLLTLFSMIKIWNEAFWKDASDAAPDARRAIPPAMYLPLAALGAIMLLLGIAAGPVYGLAVAAADQLLDTRAYIDAVLGARP